MGFLDSLDKLIKDIESGEIDKKLHQAADTFDKVLEAGQKGMTTAENGAKAMGSTAHTLIGKVQDTSDKANRVGDTVAKKLPNA